MEILQNPKKRPLRTKEDIDLLVEDYFEIDHLKNEYINIHNGAIKMEELSSINDGCTEIIVDGIAFPCFYKKGVHSLIIFLSSGHAGNSNTVFHRHKYYNLTDGHVLCIDDPSYRDYTKLTNGWFIGNKHNNYSEMCAQLIRKIQSILDIDSRHTFIIGSSSGGTAAIHTSSYLEGTTAIAINPQILPQINKWTGSFKKETGIDLSDLKKRTDTRKILTEIKSSVFIICNVEDDVDFEQIKSLTKKSLHIGIQKISKNVNLWLYDAPTIPGYQTAHANQETHVIFIALLKIIARIREDRSNKRSILDEEIIDLITSIWHEHYRYMANVYLDNYRKILSGGGG